MRCSNNEKMCHGAAAGEGDGEKPVEARRGQLGKDRHKEVGYTGGWKRWNGGTQKKYHLLLCVEDVKNGAKERTMNSGKPGRRTVVGEANNCEGGPRKGTGAATLGQRTA